MDKVEKIRMEDGRRAERFIKEKEVGDGESITVTETHVEKESPKYLAERVIEKRRPVVYERHIETIGLDGQVAETKVESIDPPESKMQLVQHKVFVDDESEQSKTIGNLLNTLHEIYLHEKFQQCRIR
jgi:hypothetical protein